MLGPSLFGLPAPQTFQYVFHSIPATPMTMMSQIGLILLMFQIGLEFDFGHLRAAKNRTVVFAIALTGVVLPFALGLGVGYWSAPYLAPDINASAYSSFLATALSITAVPILGRIMMEFNITRHYLGTITITAAAINDVVGWFLLAAVTALTLSAFSLAALSIRLMLFLAYIAFFWWVVRPLLTRVVARARPTPEKFPDSLLALLLVLIAFVDPVFSSGVLLAMNSAFMGAEVVDAQLKGTRDAAARLRRYEKNVRYGVKTFSWFIYRVRTPAFRHMLLHPQNRFRVEEAMVSLLSGDIFGRTAVQPRLALFKAIYAVSMRMLKASLASYFSRRAARRAALSAA